MPDTVQNGELGQENGLTFTVGTSQICKIIDNGVTVSVITKITFNRNEFAKPQDLADGLITFKVGDKESTAPNILTKGVPDVYFSVKKQATVLNLELPLDAVKHTTGFILAREKAAKKKPKGKS